MKPALHRRFGIWLFLCIGGLVWLGFGLSLYEALRCGVPYLQHLTQ